MKKIFALFAIALLSFTSCKNDEGEIQTPPSSSTILPTKISFINKEDQAGSTKIIYNGNKIVDATHADLSRTVYSYTGDLITQITEYDSTGKISFKDFYTYQNGKLSENNHQSIDSIGAIKSKKRETYTYNSDGTILLESYSIDPTTNVETKDDHGTEVLTRYNGNIIKWVHISSHTYSGKTYTHTTTYDYKYDDKKSPFANVIGFDALIDVFSDRNNLVSETETTEEKVDGIVTSTRTETVDYANQYNENGFLTKSSYFKYDFLFQEEYEY
ncbi:MAG: hypothetical protein C4K58_01230 [Flavobacteriaceae bacterium]|nr:MAG: hypothetical protein C4K58_01230 [Flavobacteriaceae bacterium]